MRLRAPGSGKGLAELAVSTKRTASVALGLLVCVGCAPRYLVSSDQDGTVREFNLRSPETKPLIESGALMSPTGLAIGTNGAIFVSDFRANAIDMFDGKSGEFLGVFAKDKHLHQPTGLLAFGEELLVSSLGVGDVASGVLRFAGPQQPTPGKFLGFAVQHAEVDRPMGMAIGPDGLIYLASHWTDRIVRFDPEAWTYEGTFANTSETLSAPMHLAFGPDGNLYATSTLATKVAAYHGPNSAEPGAFIGYLIDGNGLESPGQLLFTDDGDLLVTDFQSGTVRRYAGPTKGSPGNFIGVAATGAPGALELIQR